MIRGKGHGGAHRVRQILAFVTNRYKVDNPAVPKRVSNLPFYNRDIIVISDCTLPIEMCLV